MKSILVIIVISPLIIFTQNQNLDNIAINKKGGICFRVDDNNSIYNYLEFGELFNKYNYNFTFALNLGVYINQTFIDGVKILQASGHEMMDHTPDHKTSWFETHFDPSEYLGINGVDQIINGNKICLEHAEVDLIESSFSGLCDIEARYIISKSNGAFKDIRSDEIYVYLDGLDTLVWIIEVKNLNKNDPDTLRYKDVWQEPFYLGNMINETYYVFSYDNIHLSLDGYKVLANETLKLCELYGLEKPQTWIQPGTPYPRARKSDLHTAMGEGTTIGYKSGAIYIGSSIKTYNEPDASNDNSFGMQWGNFKDDAYSLSLCKKIIADGIAKHKMLIGHSHFSDLLDGWDGYCERVDQLLKWCRENEIPVLTYVEMADVLYKNQCDPYINIIPPLNIDLEENNVPDGYEKKSAEYDWTLDKINLVPEINDYSFSIDHEGGICLINGLGGIEKNQNEFTFWAKGETGNTIEVIFSWEGGGQSYIFSLGNDEWEKLSLIQSTNGNTELFIPENISLINFEVRCANYCSGQINIGGMSLTKMRNEEYVYLDLKIKLEGSHSISNNNLLYFIPLQQPYNCSPWNYEGEEQLETRPDNLVDWILVELRDKNDHSSIIKTRAGLLLSDGRIVDIDGISALSFSAAKDDYYIAVKHRNHLSVISANTVNLSP